MLVSCRDMSGRLVLDFDTGRECRDVVCLYHHADWFIGDSIHHPDKLDKLAARGGKDDVFF